MNGSRLADWLATYLRRRFAWLFVTLLITLGAGTTPFELPAGLKDLLPPGR